MIGFLWRPGGWGVFSALLPRLIRGRLFGKVARVLWCVGRMGSAGWRCSFWLAACGDGDRHAGGSGLCAGFVCLCGGIADFCMWDFCLVRCGIGQNRKMVRDSMTCL